MNNSRILGKPVYDAAGKIIGRTGEDVREPQISPAERIALGFRQGQEQAANEIIASVQMMGNLAFEAKRIRDRLAWWDFAGAEKARPKLAELESQYKEHHAAVVEHSRGLADADMKEFSQRVGRQIDIFKKCFRSPEEGKAEPTPQEKITEGLKEAAVDWIVADEKGELRPERDVVAEKCGLSKPDEN